MAIGRSVENGSLAALCLMALLSLAIKTENAGLKAAILALRVLGTGAGMAFLVRCEHVPNRIESKLIEEANRREAERLVYEQWKASEIAAFEHSRESLLRERQDIQWQQERERQTIESDRANLEQQRQQIQQQLQQDLARHEERVAADVQKLEQLKALAIAEAEAHAQQIVDAKERELEAAQSEIEILKERLRDAAMPIPPLGVRTCDRNCWDIQLLFWKNGIILDCNRQQPHDSPTYQEFLLYPRDTKDIKKIKLPEMVDQVEAILNSTIRGGVKIEQYGAVIQIVFKKGEEPRAEKEKKP